MNSRGATPRKPTTAARRSRGKAAAVVHPPAQRQHLNGDVVASTFANMELAAAKAVSETYHEQFVETNAENVLLRKDLKEHEADAITVIQYLETKLAVAIEEGTRLSTEVKRLQDREHEEKRQLSDRYEAVIRERDRQINEYASLTGKLQHDLRQASQYVQKRQEHAMELKQLHHMLEEMADKHERELSALRFQTVDRKMKLVAMEMTMRNEFKSMLEIESAKLLEAQHEGLLAHNRALESEKLGMAHDIEDLMQFTGVINAERTAMKRKAELHKQAHTEVLKHTVARNRQGRDTELKVQRLQVRVRELLAAQHTLREEVAQPFQQRISQLEEELKATQHALQTHRRELLSMRAFATQVVGQRTDLEKFFHVAIQDCRRYREGLDSTLGITATARSTYNADTCAAAVGGGGGSSARHAGTVSSGVPPLNTTTTVSTHARSVRPFNDSFRVVQQTLADPLPPVRGNGGGNSSSSQHNHTLHTNRHADHSAADKTFITQVPVGGIANPNHSTMVADDDVVCGGTVTKTLHAAAASPPPESGAYVEDMLWEDKEKVIKSLLFYINSTYYSNNNNSKAAVT